MPVMRSMLRELSGNQVTGGVPYFSLSGGRSTDPSSFFQTVGPKLYETGFSYRRRK